MSPEQFRLLTEPWNSSKIKLTPASDLYSLAVVLIELLTGARARDLAEASKLLEPYPSVVRQALLECLNENADGRAGSANQWSATLENALEIHLTQQRLNRFQIRGNFTVVTLSAMLVPQLVGSVLNIAYNSLRILTELNEHQRLVFKKLVVAYNCATFGIGVPLVVWYALPLYRAFRGKGKYPRVPPGDECRIRNISLCLPRALAIVCTLGWLPGAYFFPRGIEFFSGPVPSGVYWHFAFSNSLSWLVSLNYSYLFLLWICLNRAYPTLWSAHEPIAQLAPNELGPVRRALPVIVTGCGLIPLLGAILAIGFGSEATTLVSHGTFAFRALLIVMIGMGMVGFGVALFMYQSIREQLRVICGVEQPGRS